MTDAETRAALKDAHRLSVAPMMDWTDRHCRLFHRQFSARALLYTEMVTASGLVIGEADWLLDHDPAEHPLALQLGGSDPAMLARAVAMAVPRGFAEINLNVGCPSDRVQSGAFGACLMREPALVAECCRAMIEAAQGIPVTVKCRIGVDDQVPADVLPAFIDTVAAAGVETFIVHARMAWLQGLSPKENRTVPPLDYALVHAMKARRPELTIVLNGGLETLEAALAAQGPLDGAMIGRAAYHDPAGILGSADRLVFGEDRPDVAPQDAVRAMYPHIERELAKGTRLHLMTRHLLGAFSGRPGARRWRRILTEQANRPGAGIGVIEEALTAVLPAAA